MTRLIVGSATDVGLVRSNNQDHYLVAPGLYAVADGMGGHAAGEVASQTAIESLKASFEHASPSAGSLVAAAKAANRAVWDQARANRGMLGMGTTLVALAVVEDDSAPNGLAIAHIGDSRAYVYRDGRLSQLTTDHSLVQELVDDGQITPAQAAVHPQRHVLTRALGVEPSVKVDLLRLAPEHGDRYLLCSDGLPREASDDQIAAVLSRFADPAEAAKELVALANSKGGSDNVTVVVLDVTANDAESPTGGVGARPGGGVRAPLTPGEPPGRPVGAGAARDASSGPSPGPHDGEAMTTAVPALKAGGQAPVPAPTGRRGRSEHGLPSPRRVTWRVIGFLLLACAVIGGAIAGLAWYARSTYYVTLWKGRVAIYQGRPGGVLWFQPTLAELTGYTQRSVLAFQVPDLRSGQTEATLDDAKAYIANLVQAKRAAEQASHPPATTTVPSTAKPTSTAKPSTTVATSKRRPSSSTPSGKPTGPSVATTR